MNRATGAALVLFISGCAAATPAQPDEIVIGTITAITGDLEDYGRDWRDAVKLAAQQVNSGGGAFDGRQVRVIVENDDNDEGEARAAARRLIAAGAVGIIGPPASSAALAAKEVTGPAHVPLVSGTATSVTLNLPGESSSDADPFFFRTAPPDGLQGVVLASLAAGQYNDAEAGIELQCDRLAVAYRDDDYGTPFGRAVATRFSELGGAVAFQRSFPAGESRHDDLLSAMTAASPDCIALVAYPDEATSIVLEWYALGGASDVQWVGTEALYNAAFMEDITPEHAEGYVGTAPASNPDRPELRAFDEVFSSVVNREPPFAVLTTNVYDAAALLLLAIAHAGSVDGDAIRESLFVVSNHENGDETIGPRDLVAALAYIDSDEGINYDGASGRVDFRPNGDVFTDYQIWLYTDGGFESAQVVRADEISRAGGG